MRVIACELREKENTGPLSSHDEQRARSPSDRCGVRSFSSYPSSLSHEDVSRSVKQTSSKIPFTCYVVLHPSLANGGRRRGGGALFSSRVLVSSLIHD